MDKSVLITGGTGFIGQPLCQSLADRGYQLTVLSRRPHSEVLARCGRVTPIQSLTELNGAKGFGAIINLAGEGIADRRWSEARKQTLRDSRVKLTQQLVSAIPSFGQQPEVLVSGSAVGFYGDQGRNRVTETTAPNDEFTNRLCNDWEAAANALTDSVRVCLSRTGVVVGPGGGFLQRMVLPFKLGLGGRLGDGHQFMPWVHRADVVAAIIWMLETESASGAYNVVSPNPVENRELTRTLASVLGRPAIFPVPGFVLKAALGEMSRLLLTGQQAVPERLLDAGFKFHYPDLRAALEDAVGSPTV
ncbi:TIGR01777 family oxidoreductase [Marinobacter caseinilyticus]|uniref:TIGR01777 family oxidoreductase n=1 Tax=Marinobacter caseinilyticus TaxID=2692195 RepID=UPI00140C38BC|nr:TIGR01777 family oxidoreductase [Marinobacter caseinilyticus]